MAFWVVIILLVLSGLWAFGKIQSGLGLPMLAVLGTVAAWYVGDAFYNDYQTNHLATFSTDVLNAAWWQVALFITTFSFLAPTMHFWINSTELGKPSQVFSMLHKGAENTQFQEKLNQLFWGCVSVWVVLVVIATIKLGTQIPYYFFPFLGYKADPWSRGQIGGGISALLSLAAYFQMFLAVIFGITAALAQDGRVRKLSLLLCAITWPFYVFDRVRNNVLAVVVPAILAWVFLRLRVSFLVKIGILSGGVMLISVWFDFVIANRSNTSISAAINGSGISLQEAVQTAHHEGLNMYEELCWINTFFKSGTYTPNWGARYFAELVNPIPRALWPGKPLIGLDYSVARGQEYTDDGTTATIATGMIGQGVVNFGIFLGPVFAAFLMSCWAALLAKLDLQGERLGRIPLFALGMILTFNLGRDITFITLYTFAFGAAVVWWVESRSQDISSINISNLERTRQAGKDADRRLERLVARIPRS